MTLLARLALVAWVTALLLSTTAIAQYPGLSVEPLDISALARMLHEETGTEPADWDAFERAHKDYVERHAPLVERSCKAIKDSDGQYERQRMASVELQLAQQDLDGALFATIAAMMPADAAAGIERVRVRREFALTARMSAWCGQVMAFDAAASLQRSLQDDAMRWSELKSEVDRHRLGRRDLVRRIVRGVGEALECSERNAAQQQSIWSEYQELSDRMTDAAREAEAEGARELGAAGGADAAAARATESGDQSRTGTGAVSPHELLESLERDQQALLDRWAALHNECWQDVSTAMACEVEHEVALFTALSPRLTPMQRMTWRRAVANELSVPDDRSLGVEQFALALLRAPGVDQPLRDRIMTALTMWAEEDGAAQVAMFRTGGERQAEQYRWRFGSNEQSAATLAFTEGTAVREERAERAKAALAAMVSSQLGEEAVGAGMAALEQSAAEGQKVEFVLGEGPEEPQADDDRDQSMDPVGVAHRARPTLVLLDQFIEACSIPQAKADSMRALFATHESIVAAIADGELAALRGEAQIDLMERVKTMDLGSAMAAVDAYAEQVRAEGARVHEADDAFWTALGELAGESVPDFAVAMRVSAGLAPTDGGWAAVLSPIPGDPVRVAIRCVSGDAQRRAVLAAVAAIEASEAASRASIQTIMDDIWADWMRSSLHWQARADVSDEDRAAFGEASRVQYAERMERHERANREREALRASLVRDLEGVVGAPHVWPLRRALAAQAAPNGFRDRQRVMPVLDGLLADPALPGGVRADALGLKDDLEPELRRAEERLLESMDALVREGTKASQWVDQSVAVHATLWSWWLRDEVERRCAERLRRLVPVGVLPDATLRPIREVERGRYGM
ncbi:MAG: hypothetical protein FJ254_00210 [Phycisphaerae bacterium]|nr:hypothetical protein [Phycisphaerae bacterium]